jgi:hypothetical protein
MPCSKLGKTGLNPKGSGHLSGLEPDKTSTDPALCGQYGALGRAAVEPKAVGILVSFLF